MAESCRRRPKGDCSSRVPRATESTEDLPSDWIVPIAEGVSNCAGPGGPRAASQNLVRRAEEFFGVLLIGKALESGITVKIARCPFPDIADHPVTAEGRDVGIVGVDRSDIKRELIDVRELAGRSGVTPGETARL